MREVKIDVQAHPYRVRVVDGRHLAEELCKTEGQSQRGDNGKQMRAMPDSGVELVAGLSPWGRMVKRSQRTARQRGARFRPATTDPGP